MDETALYEINIGQNIIEIELPGGTRGERGEKGDAGPQGEPGPVGPEGPAGPAGPQGEKGDPGVAGEKGETGPANTLSIGTVTKGAEASAEITGEAPNQTLNLVLPQGIKGDTGDTGPKGDTGDTGPQGPKGDKGDKGDTGNDGFSPTVTSSKSGKTTTLTITDKNGTSTATILDGADGPTYTAGTGIDITNNVISNTQTSAQWGNITGTLSNQTDLQTALNTKANTSDLADYVPKESSATGQFHEITMTDTGTVTNEDGIISVMSERDYGTGTAYSKHNIEPYKVEMSSEIGDSSSNLTLSGTDGFEVEFEGDNSRYNIAKSSITMGADSFEARYRENNITRGSITMDRNGTTIRNVVTPTTNDMAVNQSYVDNKVTRELSSKQDTLVSGTNIKTINNLSILGSGNIDIQGGSGSSEWGSITGTLSDQTDLQDELDNKVDAYNEDTEEGISSEITTRPNYILFDVSNDTELTRTVSRIGDGDIQMYLQDSELNWTGSIAINDTGTFISNNAGTTITDVVTPTTNDMAANKGYVDSVVPTKTSDLTNDSGFITNSVNNLTNYTKTSDLSAVATSGSYNDLSNKPTIPSKTSDLTNDSNFAVTNADNKFSVGQTIAGETVVDSIRTKNMFDKNSLIAGYRFGSDGALYADGNYSATDYIEVKPGTTYTYTRPTTGGSQCICLYDSSKTFISRTLFSGVGTYTFTTTSATQYVRIAEMTSGLSANIQLEEGSIATTYSPYQNLDGMDKEVIRTTATPNSSYISTVQVNQVTKCGKIVTVDFRGLVSANIPNNTTIITLPYHFVAEGTAPAYLGGAYDYASTLWCSWGNNGNVFRSGRGFTSASGQYVHIHLVYITSD